VQNSALSIISKPRASSSDVARQWLVKFAEVCQRELTPALTEIWVEQLRDIAPEILDAACDRLAKTWTSGFLPAPGNIRAQIDSTQQGTFEDEWQGVLAYIAEWYSPDMVFSGTPRLPEDLDHAARAAGGLGHLFNCSREDLQWAKKRFVEDLTRTRQSGDLAGLLPSASLPDLLQRARAEYTPRLAAPSKPQPQVAGTPKRTERPAVEALSAEEVEARRAELGRQAQDILKKYATETVEACQ
jgi:hypothetical protein